MSIMWIALLVLGSNLDCMLQDKHGAYWIGSNGEGVYRYDGKKQQHFTTKDGLVSNYVLSIQEDSAGRLWFTTRDGVSRYDGSTFTNVTSNINNAPFNTFKPKPGSVYFSRTNGVCYYDGTTYAMFTLHPLTYQPPVNTPYRAYGVYVTYVDRAGNVWFGTQEKGVCVFNGRTFSYLDKHNLGGGPAVRAIYQDRNGVMWFGNNGGGLFRYDRGVLRNITEEQHLGNEDFLKKKMPVDKPGSMARVFAINEDADGNLWIGTVDAGVWKYDGKTFTNYTTRDGLAGSSVTVIYKDRKGALWFVVNGTTLQQFNGRTFTKVWE